MESEERIHDPFAIPAKVTDTLYKIFSTDVDPDSLFQPLNFDIKSIEIQNPYLHRLDSENPLKLPDLESFSYGPLPDLEQPFDTSLPSLQENDKTSPPETQQEQEDVWRLNLELGSLKQQKRLLTWETFENSEAADQQYRFLSEAGPNAFDAALTIYEQKTKPEPKVGKIFNPNPLLAALVQLGIGRSSIFFQRDPATNRFIQKVENSRMSGYSTQCCQSLIDGVMDLGTSFLDLRQYTDGVYAASGISPGFVAVASAMSTALSAIEDFVHEHQTHIRSLLQLQALFRQPKAIVSELNLILSRISYLKSDDDLVLAVFNLLQERDGSSQTSQLLNSILSKASSSWLECLSRRIGLASGVSDGILMTSGNLENYSEALLKTLDVDEEHTTAHTGLLSPEEERLVLESSECFEYLKKHHSQHPLIVCDNNQSTLEWAFTWEDMERIQKKAFSYQQKLTSAIESYESGALHSFDDLPRPTTTNERLQEQTPWDILADESAMQSSIDNLSSPPKISPTYGSDSYENLVTSLLNTSVTPCQNSMSTNEREHVYESDSQFALLSPNNQAAYLMPYSFSPLLSAQHQLLTISTLKSILHTHSLTTHLNTLFSFHLLGSGIFAQKLSHTLFSAETSSTERSKDRIRTQNNNMGLKLGTGDRREWPPGSSELTLALMNVLDDSRRSLFPNQHSNHRNGNRKEKIVNDEMSFALRTDLTEEEIEKILNPMNIHALDFLKLTFTPPEPLKIFFEEEIIEKYDRVFRLLLRLLRMNFVTSQLYKNSIAWNKRRENSRQIQNNDDKNEEKEILKIRWKTTTFISKLTSYFIVTAIRRPWEEFMKNIQSVEQNLNNDTPQSNKTNNQAQTSLKTLKTHHSKTLNKITSSLFLQTATKTKTRNKHSKSKLQSQTEPETDASKSLEEIFNIILNFSDFSRAAASSKSGSPRNDHSTMNNNEDDSNNDNDNKNKTNVKKIGQELNNSIETFKKDILRDFVHNEKDYDNRKERVYNKRNHNNPEHVDREENQEEEEDPELKEVIRDLLLSL